MTVTVSEFAGVAPFSNNEDGWLLVSELTLVGINSVLIFLVAASGVDGNFLANGDDGDWAMGGLLMTFVAPVRFNVNLSPPFLDGIDNVSMVKGGRTQQHDDAKQHNVWNRRQIMK